MKRRNKTWLSSALSKCQQYIPTSLPQWCAGCSFTGWINLRRWAVIFHFSADVPIRYAVKNSLYKETFDDSNTFNVCQRNCWNSLTWNLACKAEIQPNSIFLQSPLILHSSTVSPFVYLSFTVFFFFFPGQPMIFFYYMIFDICASKHTHCSPRRPQIS